MMRGNTQVRQDAIHLLHAVETKEILQIAKVAPHKREMLLHPLQLIRVIALQFQLKILVCILVLVEAIEMSTLSQSAHNLMAMSSTAKGDVHKDPTLLTDVESIHTFMEQNRYMIGSRTHLQVLSFRALRAGFKFQVAKRRFKFQISISSLWLAIRMASLHASHFTLHFPLSPSWELEVGFVGRLPYISANPLLTYLHLRSGIHRIE